MIAIFFFFLGTFFLFKNILSPPNPAPCMSQVHCFLAAWCNSNKWRKKKSARLSRTFHQASSKRFLFTKHCLLIQLHFFFFSSFLRSFTCSLFASQHNGTLHSFHSYRQHTGKQTRTRYLLWTSSTQNCCYFCPTFHVQTVYNNFPSHKNSTFFFFLFVFFSLSQQSKSATEEVVTFSSRIRNFFSHFVRRFMMCLLWLRKKNTLRFL